MKIRHALAVTIVAALGASTLTSVSFAAPTEDRAAKTERRAERRGKGGNRMEKMAQHLNLTASQKASIEPIMERSRQDAKAISSNDQLSEEQKREKMRAIRKDSQQQISAILTDAQRQQLKEMRHDKRDGRKNGGRENRNAQNGKTGNRNF